MTQELADGWYLMSTRDLERELARRRSPETNAEPSNASRLTVAQALEFRDAGNVPDEFDRTLRLVLRIDDTQELATLEERRLEFEPDFQDAPRWRRAGSRPINVVPLRRPGIEPVTEGAWWENPELAELEREFAQRGSAEGVRVPGEYRGFIFKTVLSLRSQGREVNPTTIADSIARWLSPEDAARIARELNELNP
ncbi:MAG: hypothetical protein GEU68_14300 [Actinobacteria bacterium]|nr:hypothetical protein [Actinomycetota bacterium]